MHSSRPKRGDERILKKSPIPPRGPSRALKRPLPTSIITINTHEADDSTASATESDCTPQKLDYCGRPKRKKIKIDAQLIRRPNFVDPNTFSDFMHGHIVQIVYSFLLPLDILRCEHVCKRWRLASLSSPHWHTHCVQLGFAMQQKDAQLTASFYRKHFITITRLQQRALQPLFLATAQFARNRDTSSLDLLKSQTEIQDHVLHFNKNLLKQLTTAQQQSSQSSLFGIRLTPLRFCQLIRLARCITIRRADITFVERIASDTDDEADEEQSVDQEVTVEGDILIPTMERIPFRYSSLCYVMEWERVNGNLMVENKSCFEFAFDETDDTALIEDRVITKDISVLDNLRQRLGAMVSELNNDAIFQVLLCAVDLRLSEFHPSVSLKLSDETRQVAAAHQ